MRVLALAMVLALPMVCHAAESPLRVFQREIVAAKASGVLLDWDTGKVLEVAGPERAAAPGSVLKPLFLSYGLRHGVVAAGTRVYCRKSLRVAGRPLACSHPDDRPEKDAEAALAASCNTWFAMLARRMSAVDVRSVLAGAGLRSDADLENADARLLTVLGVDDVRATPMQVASAYRALLRSEPHDGPVWDGLRGSVAYGMADDARVGGAEVMGKTGTAIDRGEWWTHGWFAGGVPGRFVIVVFVPRGDGGAAALLAGRVMRQILAGNVR